MRKLILFLAIIIGFTAVNAQTKFPAKAIASPQKKEVVAKKKVDVPVQEKKANSTIDFESKVVDYGTIDHNANGVRKFVFTNNLNDSNPTSVFYISLYFLNPEPG